MKHTHTRTHHPPHTLPSSPPHGLVVGVVVVVVVVMVVVVQPVIGFQGELCVVETPLITPFIKSLIITPTTCPTCAHPPTSPTTPNPPWYPLAPSQTPPLSTYGGVHVLEVSVSGVVEVVVEVSGDEGDEVVIVLASSSSSSSSSSSGVVFKVTASATAAAADTNLTTFIFVVEEGDKVEVSGLQHRILHQASSSSSSLIYNTKARFGAITSYTKVTRGNQITLRLNKERQTSSSSSSGEVECESGSYRGMVECASVEEQVVSGCYHPTMVGRGARDIHIVEVEGSADPNKTVVLNLAGGGGGSGVRRNITVVLRSSTPTTWRLHTTQLHGTVTLLVGGGDQVENTSAVGGGISASVGVQVRRIDIPHSFDQLILSVLTSVGPPVSYSRSAKPTHIRVTVPRKTGNSIDVDELPDFERPTVYAEEPESILRAGLSVSCDYNKNAMTLALPYAIAERVGGVAMALSDRACVGVRNGTHIVLKSPFTKCKFVRHDTNGAEIYANMVSLELGPSLTDDEDLGGSGYGPEDYYPPLIPPIRVTCPPSGPPRPPKPPPRPPGPSLAHGGNNEKPTTPTTTTTTTTAMGVGGASYTLSMYQDSGFTQPITTTTTTTSAGTSATSVGLHARLYVRAALASVLPHTSSASSSSSSSTSDLRVVLEECTVSNSSAANVNAHTRTLLRKSCRVDDSVSVSSPFAHSHAPTFNFQVLPEYVGMSAFYLHCLIGVCTTNSLPQAGVIKCIEPALYCSKPALLRVFEGQHASSSLQLLTLGPLTAGETTKSALFGGITTNDKTNTVEQTEEETNAEVGVQITGDEQTQIVVMGGLSTEVVVGIAVASFVIGVCLTATLWLIHMKTDPRRQKRHQESSSVPRNSGYDLSAHSGSSTPSSQAPMTA